MYEVKADALETSFEAVETSGKVSVRPALSGARESGSDARRAFVDGFLRQGQEVEQKSFAGTTGIDGGFAIPREIDAMIDATLKAVSPIRAIANVVQVGSAGYRKLVTSGGTPSGWVAETAA
jgi:HK97 family phage major capsid protein